jgi:heme exporter protein C
MIRAFANPARFLKISKRMAPLCLALAALCLVPGLYLALVASPPDYQQGESVRIMYVHVPSAWLAMGVYASMAVAAVCALVWKHIVAELYARAAAPLGCAFTAICLATGSLWGKPMWGTWWVWDARLTSVFILLLLYLGYIALQDAFDDEQRGIDAGNWLLIAGAVNLPVIKFSVDWWTTLHQPASLTRLARPAIDPAMLKPLLCMGAGFALFFTGLVLLRLETEIAKRKKRVKVIA